MDCEDDKIRFAMRFIESIFQMLIQYTYVCLSAIR